jgi:hypothetical protein
MQGLFTLDSVDPNIVFQAIEPPELDWNGSLHCYSRLPMRQLLRNVASNRGGLWWITEQTAENAVRPQVGDVLQHLRSHTPLSGDIVLIDALHWMVQHSGPAAVLDGLQELDSLARKVGFSLVFPVEPLAFEHRLWARIRALAPQYPLHGDGETVSTHSISPKPSPPPLGGELDPSSEEEGESHSDDVGGQLDQPTVIHLVSLPRAGFSLGLLNKRMLQWKRMGFDLSALEPALSIKDMDQVYELYIQTERQITQAIDTLRLLEHHETLFTVTEKEIHSFRAMNLMDLDESMAFVNDAISTR